MKISAKDFGKIKKILLETYFMARDCDAFFIMENIDYAMSILQEAEAKAIKEKQKLM